MTMLDSSEFEGEIEVSTAKKGEQTICGDVFFIELALTCFKQRLEKQYYSFIVLLLAVVCVVCCCREQMKQARRVKRELSSCWELNRGGEAMSHISVMHTQKAWKSSSSTICFD